MPWPATIVVQSPMSVATGTAPHWDRTALGPHRTGTAPHWDRTALGPHRTGTAPHIIPSIKHSGAASPNEEVSDTTSAAA
jgi:hypothetical protein